jgi:hypothetical protein
MKNANQSHTKSHIQRKSNKYMPDFLHTSCCHGDFFPPQTLWYLMLQNKHYHICFIVMFLNIYIYTIMVHWTRSFAPGIRSKDDAEKEMFCCCCFFFEGELYRPLILFCYFFMTYFVKQYQWMCWHTKIKLHFSFFNGCIFATASLLTKGIYLYIIPVYCIIWHNNVSLRSL